LHKKNVLIPKPAKHFILVHVQNDEKRVIFNILTGTSTVIACHKPLAEKTGAKLKFLINTKYVGLKF
jgi:hypothetical protein